MKVIITDESLDRLEDQLDFMIEERKLPKTYVLPLGKKLLRKAKQLDKHPYRGQYEPSLSPLNQGHRRIIEGDFKIIYFIEGNAIYVSDFFYSHRDPDKMNG